MTINMNSGKLKIEIDGKTQEAELRRISTGEQVEDIDMQLLEIIYKKVLNSCERYGQIQHACRLHLLERDTAIQKIISLHDVVAVTEEGSQYAILTIIHYSNATDVIELTCPYLQHVVGKI